METMRIYELQEYAKKNGFKTGHFLCICEKGVFEFQWVDAYYGFIKMIQPEHDGMIMVKTMIDLFGMKQEYLPTIGYDSDD